MLPHPNRREFLRSTAFAATTAACAPTTLFASTTLFAQSTTKKIRLPDNSPMWQPMVDSALAVLAGNIKQVPKFDQPVLLEGAVYPGIWQECGPHESLVYATLRDYIPAAEGQPTPLQIARNNHMAFFKLQREDGQLPASVKMSDVGYGQIQMVVPIAATAWELAQLTHDDEFLATAYAACARWDAWLRRYRDTRKTGLVEGFCTYDTGHDNSPRWKGVPNRCPDADARKFPPGVGVPRLCPDLSATVYGGRIALAAMARALGKPAEADHWLADAEHIRRLIISRLYCEEDFAFYDLDTDNNFVRVRGDLISRVLGEHVLIREDASDKTVFQGIWGHQLHNPKAFWAPYPLTSIAMDDPTFVRPIPRNSWGGASQALTALRAPRWMEHYGKGLELRQMMQAWVRAIALSGGFRQQLDPLTGAFTLADPSGYSPAALVYLDFLRRLAS